MQPFLIFMTLNALIFSSCHHQKDPSDLYAHWAVYRGDKKGNQYSALNQIDTGNAIHGGGSPEYFLNRFPGRSITVHLKEYSPTNDKAVIGEGETKWHDIFQLCETIGGTQWYIVEQESYAYPPLECVDLCLKALKAMGK